MVQHVVILRFSALGDVAMTLPVVYSVARANPHVRFTMVTRPFFARLFVAPPSNLRIEAVDANQYKGAGGTVRLLNRLAALRPTAVADLHNVLRTWTADTFFRLKGVKVVMVDKKRAGRRKALETGQQQRCFIDRYVDVFRELGLDAPLTFKGLDLSGHVADLEVKNPAVGIAPFARYFNKTYPMEMMRRVVELLCREGVNVYLFGARGAEAEVLDGWASEIDGATSVAGRFGIEQELELMSRMNVMLSMDSANQHLASLVGVPVVTLWGSTTPECGFMPYGQKREDSMVAGVECQPCSVAGGPVCPNGEFRCMRMLDAEAVANKLMKLC